MTTRYHQRWKYRDEGAELELICGDFRLRVWLLASQNKWGWSIDGGSPDERYSLGHCPATLENREIAVAQCQDEFTRVLREATVDWECGKP